MAPRHRPLEIVSGDPVFRADGSVLLQLSGLASGEAVFDDRNRLNLIGSGQSTATETRSAGVVCTLDGQCRQATDAATVPADSERERLGLVGWAPAT